MKKLSFNAHRYITHGKIHLPLPDGYHSGLRGPGGNADWCYIVPENVPLSAEHIDAKPYGFGISAAPSGSMPFESGKIESFKGLFLQMGYLSHEASVGQLICSDHCAFLFQSWTSPSDASFNKINGFLFTRDCIHQFHIFANHNANIAHQQSTINEFLSVSASWMERVYIDGEEKSFAAEQSQVSTECIMNYVSSLLGDF